MGSFFDSIGDWASRTVNRNTNTINSFFTGKAPAPNTSAASPQAVSLKNEVAAGLGSSIMSWFQKTPTGQAAQSAVIEKQVDSKILQIVKNPFFIAGAVILAGLLILKKRG